MDSTGKVTRSGVYLGHLSDILVGSGRTRVVRPEGKRCVLAGSRRHTTFASNFSNLETNAKTDLDLPVAPWFLLRRTAKERSEAIGP